MTTTNNAPISFRLTDDELELLRQYQEDGEKSLNLTAKRLLLNALGVDAKKSSIQVVNTVDTNQIKELIETAVQEKLTELTTVDNVDTVKNLITESLEYGDIKDAIAASYAGMMAQFNGLLEEWQELQKQLQELKSIPPAVPQLPTAEGLTTDNEELTTDNYQLPEQETGNREQGTGEYEDVDQVDSENNSDTQSPLWDKVLMKNPVDSIRKQLKKKNITKSAEEIKQAFLNAGFDGINHQSLREEVIKTLSQE
jgi:hypothetical protein